MVLAKQPRGEDAVDEPLSGTSLAHASIIRRPLPLSTAVPCLCCGTTANDTRCDKHVTDDGDVVVRRLHCPHNPHCKGHQARHAQREAEHAWPEGAPTRAVMSEYGHVRRRHS
jgi:hypothetical protein